MIGDVGRLDVHELSGRRLGKYAIGKKLGEGGMAVVYQALHLDFEVAVAVKFLLPDLTREERTRHRFRKEARLLFKLKHPNLVRVIELLEEGGLLGMAMDYVEGEDLSMFLREQKQPPSLQTIREIFGPVLDAVGYAHRKGILHRDLKPSNILLEKKEGQITPHVVDFGVAKSFEEESLKTKTGVILGTPLYCSPEQIQGMRALDARCDIYALGCTLYEMLALRTPYADKGGVLQILFAHLYEPIPSLVSVYPKEGAILDALFQKVLAKDRKERFASCEDFASELTALFSSLPASLEIQGSFVSSQPLVFAAEGQEQAHADEEDSGAEEITAPSSLPPETPPVQEAQDSTPSEDASLPTTGFPGSPTLDALEEAEDATPEVATSEEGKGRTPETATSEEGEGTTPEMLAAPEWTEGAVRSVWDSAAAIYGSQKHSLFFRASVGVFLVGLLMLVALIIFFHAQKPAPMFAPAPQVPRRAALSAPRLPTEPRPRLPSVRPPPDRVQPLLTAPALPSASPPPALARPPFAPATKAPPPSPRRRPVKRPSARLFEIDDPL